MAEVRLVDVAKVYPDGTAAVSGLDLEVADGELLVLVGPSGCGKTTALRLVAGLEEVTAGEVRIGGRVVTHVAARDRDVAMVFQSYALYPHLSVARNIGFGLKLRKVPPAEIDRRVGEAARILGLEGLLDRKPRHLSGGQRQRVAMGRAIVREPQVFLLDEPLSNLDAKLRVQMRTEIARIRRRLGVTTIYVTHDQVEALTLGHRVAVMDRGVLQQVDVPQALYDRPVNVFVAGFIGSPAMNLLRGSLEGDADRLALVLGGQRLVLPAAVVARRPRLRSYVGSPVVVGIRPEDVREGGGPGRAHLRAVVDLVEATGPDVVAHLRVDAPGAEVDAAGGGAGDGGAPASGDAPLVARFGARAPVREGGRVEVSVDAERLHLFDADSGVALDGGMPARPPDGPVG